MLHSFVIVPIVSPQDLHTILFYHRSISDGAADTRSLGWTSAETQRQRFDILSQVGDLNGCEIMDLGCGHGDFRSYLSEKVQEITYYGIDCLTSFLEIAHRLYGDLQGTYFYQGDFTSMPFPEVDYMICCGAFNYQRSSEDLYLPVIGKMFRAARRGVAFNMLDASVFQQHGALQGHNAKRVMAFCQTLTSQAELIQGYAEEDFTVFLYPESLVP